MRQVALDILGLGGLGSFVYGVWQLHQPTAFMVGGAVVLAYSLVATRGDAKRGAQ